MINVKNVVNRSVDGAISGAIAGGVQGLVVGGTNGLVSGLLGGLNIFSGFGNMFSGNSYSKSGTAVTLGFKRGHPYSGYPGILSSLKQTGGMAWPYRPSIDVARSINYENTTPVHTMQDFRSFRNNSSANITISGPFSAQTTEEGAYMQAAIHFLRTASLMSFGVGGAVPAGMPPPVLNLNAYGTNNITNVPVVLDTVLTSYPPDVDYISVNGNEIPTVMTITATMTVMLAPDQLRSFNLDAFAAGSMQGFV